MKVKHLLFSSLFLSAGFTACTSDVEEFVAQTQTPSTEAPKGIELGEGFQINVTNENGDSETRATLENVNGKWYGSWNVGEDKLGAAMYSMVLSKVESGETKGNVANFYNYFGTGKPNVYATNNEFVSIESEDGEKFQSEANSMVGAYLLYYPYNADLNKDKAFTEISVYPEEKAVSVMNFNVDNISEEINNRIVAANSVYFNQNGTQAPSFKLKQIPNIYMLKFYINEKLLMNLVDPIKIDNIIVEAKGAGKNVINTNGTVAPAVKEPVADHYNNVGDKTIDGFAWNGQEEAKRAESFQFAITYSADEAKNEPYYMPKVGKDGLTAPFYYSVLPMDPSVDEITFTIVTTVNGVEKVYSKSYKEADADNSVFLAIKKKITGKGEVLNLNVNLDTEGNAAQKIYTLKQFNAAYNTNQTEFNFAVAIPDTLQLNAERETATTFKGKPVTVNAISGKKAFTAENEINVLGDVVADGITILFKEDVTIGGKVEAKNNGSVIFEQNAVINGAIVADKGTVKSTGEATELSAASIEAKNGATIDLKATATVDGEVVANASIVKFNAAETGALTATDDADVTYTKESTIEGNVTVNASTVSAVAGINGDLTAQASSNVTATGNIAGTITATASIVTATGDVAGDVVATEASKVTLTGEVAGNVTATESSIAGAFTAQDITMTEAQANAKQISAANISVDVNSNFVTGELTATSLDVFGTATATKVIEIGTLYVQPLAEVTVTGKSVKTSKIDVVKVNKNAVTGKIGTLNTNANITLANVTNDGEIKANQTIITSGNNNNSIYGIFTVNGEFNQNATADNTEIIVAEGGNLVIAAKTVPTSVVNNGIVTINAKKELAATEFKNNGKVEVLGTMTEKDKNTLEMTDAAEINVKKGATLSIVSSGAIKQPGIVYAENGATFDKATAKFNTVAYKWNGKVAPTSAKAFTTIIAEEGATLDANADDATTLILRGNVTLGANLALAGTKNLYVEGDVTISAKTNQTISLTNRYKLDGTEYVLSNEFAITEGAKLTLGDNITLQGKDVDHDKDNSTPAVKSKLFVKNGGSFDGTEKIINLDIVY